MIFPYSDMIYLNLSAPLPQHMSSFVSFFFTFESSLDLDTMPFLFYIC